MNFKFFIISIIIISGFAGTAFASNHGQTIQMAPQEFSQEEIDEMKNKAVHITMHDGTFVIELFPDDAPNTVNNFLKLVERGYYDGTVFHRIIPGFMIQAGDPNTKNPEAERSSWGQGGPGYQIDEEFNTIQHDRGIVSMARSTGINTAGSQFFIVHNDANFLDGEYTVFGRLVSGTFSDRQLDNVAALATDTSNAPLDVSRATIIKATILDPYTPPGFAEPDRNTSIVTRVGAGYSVKAGNENYLNYLHKVSFDLPYRWAVVGEGTGNYLNLVVEPTAEEHNVQQAIQQSGFTPQILISSEEIDSAAESTGVASAFFLVKGGDEPKVLSNYIFENDNGVKAHVVVTTQNLQVQSETFQFKTMQIHFLGSELSYSIVYINLTEWYRYEINAFATTVSNFEVMYDGKMQPIDFSQNPVFRQLITDSREKPEPESLPPVRVGGCLIATASYGSELAPQVQQLRELRDNTVLQTESGSAFMAGFNQFYYSFSPTIADYERENPAFKEAVKLTLTPLLTSLTLLQYADIDSESEMLGYGIGIILLNIGMYFVVPAVLIMRVRSFYKLQ